MYVCFSVGGFGFWGVVVGVIVAWDIRLLRRHFSWSGHLDLSLQLHIFSSGVFSVFLIIFELCDEMVCFMFDVVL